MQLAKNIPMPQANQSLLAEVTSVNDPEGLNRVQVKLLSYDGFDNQDGTLWARVAVPFAGSNRGAFMLPEVGDEVIVTFINSDPRYPVVIGSMWNGRDSAPETLGGGGDSVDRWTIVGKAGTRIAIEEPVGGQPRIILSTPQGQSVEIADQGGGKFECIAAGTTITIDPAGVTLQCPGKVSIQASQVEVTSGMVNVNAAMADFSGVVKCSVLMATTVVGTTYTPGAGNVW